MYPLPGLTRTRQRRQRVPRVPRHMPQERPFRALTQLGRPAAPLRGLFVLFGGGVPGVDVGVDGGLGHVGLGANSLDEVAQVVTEVEDGCDGLGGGCSRREVLG